MKFENSCNYSKLEKRYADSLDFPSIHLGYTGKLCSPHGIRIFSSASKKRCGTWMEINRGKTMERPGQGAREDPGKRGRNLHTLLSLSLSSHPSLSLFNRVVLYKSLSDRSFSSYPELPKRRNIDECPFSWSRDFAPSPAWSFCPTLSPIRWRLDRFSNPAIPVI